MKFYPFFGQSGLVGVYLRNGSRYLAGDLDSIADTDNAIKLYELYSFPILGVVYDVYVDTDTNLVDMTITICKFVINKGQK